MRVRALATQRPPIQLNRSCKNNSSHQILHYFIIILILCAPFRAFFSSTGTTFNQKSPIENRSVGIINKYLHRLNWKNMVISTVHSAVDFIYYTKTTVNSTHNNTNANQINHQDAYTAISINKWAGECWTVLHTRSKMISHLWSLYWNNKSVEHVCYTVQQFTDSGRSYFLQGLSMRI